MKKTIFLLIACTFCANAQEAYNNPVDGKTYVADWVTYGESQSVVSPERVNNLGVRLLSVESEFEDNVTAPELASFILDAQNALKEASSSSTEGGEILLQVTLNNESPPELKFSYRGNLTEETLQKFKELCGKINLNSRLSPVTFQVHFSVAGA